MSRAHIIVEEGRPFPLGATWTGLGVNFALFSAHATRVELCLFDDTGEHEIARVDLPEYTDEVWHGFLPDARPGTIYGYRVHGPYEPEQGHRFNPNKLLLDPYAKSTVGELKWDPALFGYQMETTDDKTFDTRDSAPFMPKGRVIDPAFSWGEDRAPRTPWENTVIYEAHVRGYTKLHPDLPEDLRGTFRGLAHRSVRQHLRGLGVSAIELLPIHMFVNDDHLLQKGLTNFWGYNSIGFFAPDRRYASVPDFAFSEFKEMVARLHHDGIEVILDVVYNHTAEGNERGPTLSMRGIDNASYYRLMPDQPRYYINDTGTGNTLNLSHPRVLQMVTDSLRYWVQEMHVDGFRFDLGTILAREPYGFDEGGGFLDSCRQDPVLSSVKLITEPWDCGPGGYQVGHFPPGWAEWNDRFRDTVRAFWRGDAGKLSEFATRITASADLFNRRGRKPWASINFITAHDGFTLRDLVSYENKHNEANGEDGRDGNDNNISANYGVEGPSDDQALEEVRWRQMRNMLATLLLSQGTPMLLAGDEFGRTQKGNNNAYCQDNEISWVDWKHGAREHDLTDFVRDLLSLRRRFAILRRGRFLNGEWNEELGLRDVSWLTPAGVAMEPEQWSDGNARSMAVIFDGRAQTSGLHRRGADRTLMVLFNAHTDAVEFTLPEISEGRAWALLVDTNRDPPCEAHDAPDEQDRFAFGDTYLVTGRSTVLLELLPQRRQRRQLAGATTAAPAKETPEAAPAAADAKKPEQV